MKTYLKLIFNSEGEKPSEIVDILYGLGFEPQKGEYDMVYNWNDGATVKDTIWFADKIQASLEGTGVNYYIETTE
ncbi:MAG: hypothetical protein R6W73_02370 [Candidatus Saliniplasma sp.]